MFKSLEGWIPARFRRWWPDLPCFRAHTAARRDIKDEQRRRPAFLPDTPQEQTRDYRGPRVSGLELNVGIFGCDPGGHTGLAWGIFSPTR
jgi:hypothetical protein